MAKNVLLLSDLIGRAHMLDLACGRCERRGRLCVARLSREYAPETPLATLRQAQIGDCPNRNSQQEQEQERCERPTSVPNKFRSSSAP
jgi:hypothetical protein